MTKKTEVNIRGRQIKIQKQNREIMANIKKING